MLLLEMDFDQNLDPTITAIKEKLNREQIKLWLPPYHSDKETEEVEVRFSKYLR